MKSFHQLQSELTSLTSEVAAVHDSRTRWSDVVGSGCQHHVEGLHHLSSECGSVVQEGSGIVGGGEVGVGEGVVMCLEEGGKTG